MTDFDQQQQLTRALVATGRLEVEVAHLNKKCDEMHQSLKQQDLMLEKINTTLSEARGGWRTLILVGGAAGVIGSVITWLTSHISK